MHRISVRWMMSLLVWCCLTGTASAVSLGKIEVASHLGEPFFAQVEVHLAEGEHMDKVHASIASLSDYRIMEIYREPTVASIQVARKSDGGPVLELSSAKPVHVPFFNLVVKLSYERFTQFKKYPVFLELPKAVQPASVSKKHMPETIKAKGPEVLPVILQPKSAAGPKAAVKAQENTSFKPFDGWARASVYGPIVRGDMLSTVAQRLRIDNRYTLAQVVVALYEKNPDKFNAGNFNLLKKGAMLKVPTRAEIERHTPAEASRIFQQHLDRWRELTKKPRYAAEKRAQETRYSPRIRMGDNAEAKQQEGTAAAISVRETDETMAKASVKVDVADATTSTVTESSSPTTHVVEAEQQVTPKPQETAAVTSAATPVAPKHEGEAGATAVPVAQEIDRQLKSLELQLKQMQLQLALLQEEKKQDAERTQWMLLGMALLIVILLLALLMALRRKPASEEIRQSSDDMESSSDQMQGSVGAVSSPVESVREETSEVEVSSAMQETALSETTVDEMDKTPSQPVHEDEVPAVPVTAEDVSSANVDHLADADVYLRYGMEDEAMKMVNLALQADPHRVDAHIKKILILSFFAKEDELKRNIAASMQAIAKEDRERFLAALRDMGLDDVLSGVDVESDETAQSDNAEEEVADADEHDVTDEQLDDAAEHLSVDDAVVMPVETEEKAALGAPASQDDRDIASNEYLSQADTGEDKTRLDAATAEVSAEDGEELEFDVSGFELGDVSVETHVPRESGLLAEDDALNFDFEVPEKQQEDTAAQTGADTDSVQKLDRLLDQLEKDDDTQG